MFIKIFLSEVTASLLNVNHFNGADTIR